MVGTGDAFGSGMQIVYSSQRTIAGRKLMAWINSWQRTILFHSLITVLFTSALEANTRVFPQIGEEKEVDDILEHYPDYLRFILAVASQVDRASANRLHKNYQKLVKFDRSAAARFLKSLRFEIVHKVELMGTSPRAITTQNTEIRRWVRRFVPEWSREADEHLFRAVAMRAIEKNREN